MHDTLRRVQDLVLLYSGSSLSFRVLLDVRDQVFEIAQVGLVGADLLGDVAAPEGDGGEGPVEGLGKRRAVDIGEWDEFVVFRQALAGVDGVREGSPVADAVAEARGFGLELGVVGGGGDVEVVGDAEECLGEEQIVTESWLRGLKDVFVLVDELGEGDVVCFQVRVARGGR